MTILETAIPLFNIWMIKWDEVEVKCVPKAIEAWVMQCSDYVEILKPVELRNRILERCKGILERYR